MTLVVAKDNARTLYRHHHDAWLSVTLGLLNRCRHYVLPGSKVRRCSMHHDYADEKRGGLGGAE